MSLYSYALSYQLSPIFLIGGIAGTGVLPLSNYLGTVSGGILNPSGQSAAQFKILPGHSLMDIEIAKYPWANLVTAANAVFVNELRLAYEMIIPANADFPSSAKLSVMTNLKKNLDSHTALGGWYNVATPSYVYQGCLLTNLKDSSEDETGQQPQVRWIWEFSQPLITASDLQAAQNPFMGRISSQNQNAGDPPGSQPLITAIGQPSANIAQNIVVLGQNPAAGNVPPSGLVVGATNIQSISPILPPGSF